MFLGIWLIPLAQVIALHQASDKPLPEPMLIKFNDAIWSLGVNVTIEKLQHKQCAIK